MTEGLRIKRIYDPASPDDGQRVLVDRVWPRGISKQTASLSLWLREIAPSTVLRQWFGHRPDRWDVFRGRYHAELDANESAVATLRELVKAGPVTLLYGAHDTVHNNAQALVDYLRENERR
ncbi:DUF488 domain-containing protein [Labrys okinawensis]|uniref:DUF488 domain-containing protein n=1 Tax=Labrys okinawensis TaxID=346911 RepID=UPI0039BD77BA